MFHQHNCPACGSTNLVENGATHYGKARLKCKHCPRQFVQHRTYAPLSRKCKRRIELLLAQRIALAAICRDMEIQAPSALQLWLWMALDRATGQVIALFVGNRGAEGALGIWQAIPENYRQKACF